LTRASGDVLNEQIVLDLVLELRRRMPRLGGRKLYHLLQSDFVCLGFKIGRDKFFDFLQRHGLLVERKKRFTRTTHSFHRFYKYNNLLKDSDITAPNECFVADITYIRTDGGFVYLFLLTDYFSRKIVGWSLSNSLSIEGGLQALKMALKQRKGASGSLIHHSDRGVQYCSRDYVGLLTKHGSRISMTEENHCYENAVAERVNGILKDEFFLSDTFRDFNSAHKAVKEAVQTYNNLRPHWSLGLKVPAEVHRQAA
jgi:transposase InsO family protein